MDQRDYWRLVARNFYTVYCPNRIEELDYIDYNYPVTDVRLDKGTRLWGYKDPRVSPYSASFFCNTGTPQEILGIHGASTLKTHPRPLPKVLHVYEVLQPVPHALKSICAPGVDKWSERGKLHDVGGGGWQFKIPQPWLYMHYLTPFPQR